MTTRSERLREPATALVLVLLGLFLYSRLSNGTLLYYINARFAGLTLAAALGLMAMGATYGSRRIRALNDATDSAAHGHNHAHDHTHDHTHDHAHDHAHAHSHGSWLALALIALPAVLGLAIKPKALGASAMSGRDLTVSAAAISPGRAAIERRLAMPPGERTILDWLLAFQNQPDPAAHVGQPAKLIGFVYRDDQTPPDLFLISRFTIRCCVADGMAVWLPVRWPDAAKLTPDDWVEVEGTFAVGTLQDKDVPMLAADRVTPVEPPAQPYLYP